VDIALAGLKVDRTDLAVRFGRKLSLDIIIWHMAVFAWTFYSFVNFLLTRKGQTVSKNSITIQNTGNVNCK